MILEINENADDAHFVLTSNPWFVRGSDFTGGLSSGVLAFSSTSGHVTDYSFRVVLNTIFKRNSKINKKNKKK